MPQHLSSMQVSRAHRGHVRGMLLVQVLVSCALAVEGPAAEGACPLPWPLPGLAVLPQQQPGRAGHHLLTGAVGCNADKQAQQEEAGQVSFWCQRARGRQLVAHAACV